MEAKREPIRLKTIIEILGKPKEHVEKTLREYIKKIKEHEGFAVLTEYYADAREQSEMFSAFAELEIVVNGIQELSGFCFDFMPSSIEILKPEKLAIEAGDLSNFLNDLQGKLHAVDMVAKQLRSESDFLKRNLRNALKNTISLVLTIKKQCTLEEISKYSGTTIQELQDFLDTLTKEGKIKKEDNLYSLT